jgi:hypothetical protein
MSTLSEILLSQISYGQKYLPYDGTNPNFASTAHKGNGYYGLSDGMHTVSVSIQGFRGELRFQGSLMLEPGDADWFDLNDNNAQLVQFGDLVTPTTGTFFANLPGNLVWFRASVTNFQAGVISKVLYTT